LEIEEYIACMKNENVEITMPEVLTLALTADMNGD
jgi:hypothetical protein